MVVFRWHRVSKYVSPVSVEPFDRYLTSSTLHRFEKTVTITFLTGGCCLNLCGANSAGVFYILLYSVWYPMMRPHFISCLMQSKNVFPSVLYCQQFQARTKLQCFMILVKSHGIYCAPTFVMLSSASRGYRKTRWAQFECNHNIWHHWSQIISYDWNITLYRNGKLHSI